MPRWHGLSDTLQPFDAPGHQTQTVDGRNKLESRRENAVSLFPCGDKSWEYSEPRHGMETIHHRGIYLKGRVVWGMETPTHTHTESIFPLFLARSQTTSLEHRPVSMQEAKNGPTHARGSTIQSVFVCSYIRAYQKEVGSATAAAPLGTWFLFYTLQPHK